MLEAVPFPRPRALHGLRAIAAQYDAFLVDLHGVVHEGGQPFDGVTEALHELAAAHRRVIFLTNTSRASAAVVSSLEAIGIGKDLYEAIVSSGDVTREALLRRDRALFDLLPSSPRCVHVGEAAYVPWLFEPDLGLAFGADLANADLVVATAPPRRETALADVQRSLEPAAARSVPLVCTNPDRVIPTANGVVLGPGTVADAYAELGAPVFLYGKPHAPMYLAARRQLGGAPLERVVAIGDLLDTDIRGARGAGIASVLVTGTGGHAALLGTSPSDTALEALWASAGIAPDMLLPRLIW
jgi:HAD superfamily hydrolase (TIGR01459 family)